MAAIGAKTDNIFLSCETAVKQSKRHSDLLPKEYCLIDLAIKFGEMRSVDKYLHFLYEESVFFQRTYHILIKSCRDGRELYVVSFHRVRPQDVVRLRKKGALLRRHYR